MPSTWSCDVSRASETLEAFFALSPDLLCVRGEDGYLHAVNPVWQTALGWSEAELRDRPWSEFVHPSDLPTTDELEQRCRQSTSGYVTYKNRWRAQDGSYHWLQWRVSPYRNGRSYGIAQDVTETTWQGSRNYLAQVQAAVKLRDRAIAASSVGIVIADATLPDMPLIYVNPAFERITGYSPAEVLGYNCRFLQGKHTSTTELERLRAAIRAGEDCTVTLLNYRKDGQPFWNELSISPIYSGPQLTHFVGIQNDVTERIQAVKAVQLEKTRSERLLQNILPQPIIQQLKTFTGSLAQQFDTAAILFADIVGFTPLSAAMQPLELIEILNRIFSTFDRLAEQYGVEKIKTIGDAYLAAAGIPLPQPEPVAAVADLAIAMQAASQQFSTAKGQPIRLRIGLHTGPVVAGVIGLKKFSYDLWGDTVNVAARLEESSEPGRIQVSQAVYEQLGDRYHCQPRGQVTLKGKGPQATYWLLARRSQELSPAGLGTIG